MLRNFRLICVICIICLLTSFLPAYSKVYAVPSLPRDSKVVSTLYATDDIVISDFNVADYGVDSTGVQDATVYIQQAIDDCYNDGGGTVWLPAGKYKVTNTILVKPFVTVRGDWRDPDTTGTGYGTVILADVASNGPTVFKIGGSSAVVGLTVYYPNQNAANPVPYNFTFEIPGNAWNGATNYHASTIKNVTMLNSYRGICISNSPSDHGGTPAYDQVHEVATIVNVKGTCLQYGLYAFNSADVDTYEWVIFNNSYWANAGSAYNAPSRTTLDTWTRANGYGFVFGDLEWMQGIVLRASDYLIGMRIVSGLRAQFCGELAWTDLTNCNVALQVDNLDTRWGISFSRSIFQGNVGSNPQAIKKNIAGGNVKIVDSIITGSTSGSGISITNPGSPAVCPHSVTQVRKPSRNTLYDVTKSPYSADKTGTNNATTAIQNALNAAGNNGGGIVYLPAGQYKVDTHLTVPAGVELRGACNTPNRDTPGLSKGTIIKAYEGHNTSNPDGATACVTLNGAGAGIRGIRFWYPNNNPINGIVPYPFTIRGVSTDLYAIYCGFVNSYNGLSMSGNNHYIKKVWGTCFRKGMVISGASVGYIEGCLFNPTHCVRTGFSGWITEGNISTVINYCRANLYAYEIYGASDERLLNLFTYAAHTFLYSHGNSNTTLFNGGHDGGGSTNGVVRIDGTCKVVNFMMYWNSGSISYGNPTIYNLMYVT